MTRVAVLTPDPADPSFAGQWPGVLERLATALSEAGITAEAAPWIDHVEDASGLTGYPLVLPLLAWGYHRDHPRWLLGCKTWAAAGVRMLNPPSVIGWNSDKSYLGRLADKGVPIPETLWVESMVQGDADAAFDRFGTDTIIVKPRVSGGAWKTLRVSRGEALTDAPDGPSMIQPYLPSIETEGETSLLFFGGALSHAVNKRPVTGEFRIQVQYGGKYQALAEPPAGAMALARQTLAAIDEDLLYARIDMARGPDGGWLLMEAELIEPDFYLGSAPEGGARFAEAVKARL
ncbi:ATP-grasp domain protein [Brevundimonas basaltis]|uniref:Glutathione synthase/RimK-type ligase-like ATP-grasp enzyme n=1 Tax=Brevundimonas basaltis TaxID=472166 RepID=A0A7W8MGW5_9CAUL|nr:transporter [Brevundimonas basaltis]MBB5291612.1 glutathione synthase/RimK-type ligase-like ATP-grasp enzyme [Brevundimonas basaltis]